MNKKIKIFLAGFIPTFLLLAGFSVGIIGGIAYIHKQQVINEFVNVAFGGKENVKKVCLDMKFEGQREIIGNQLVLGEKMCDCVVEQIHRSLYDAEIFSRIEESRMIWEDAGRYLLNIFITINSTRCEIELKAGLNRKYTHI